MISAPASSLRGDLGYWRKYSTKLSHDSAKRRYLASPAPQLTQATAPEHYVNADKLNLRDQPGGKVISSLKHGEKVHVYEHKAEWARISLDGQPERWISYKNLCSGSNCIATSPPKSARPAPQPACSTTPEYGSSCPCSSGRICIGPSGMACSRHFLVAGLGWAA